MMIPITNFLTSPPKSLDDYEGTFFQDVQEIHSICALSSQDYALLMMIEKCEQAKKKTTGLNAEQLNIFHDYLIEKKWNREVVSVIVKFIEKNGIKWKALASIIQKHYPKATIKTLRERMKHAKYVCFKDR